MVSNITKQDMLEILNGLTEEEKKKLSGSSILITGFAGSLGYSLLHFFLYYAKELRIKKIYGIDNYVFGQPEWLDTFKDNSIFDLRNLDITICDLEFAKDANFIFHMASLASPVYYRLYPIETIDADVLGLRRLMDFYRKNKIKGFLFYSTSETYGDPIEGQVPTPESYWGNVNTCGPRACYDESKRFGETLCYNYFHKYNMPIRIVRPFNNYGPGMRINDQRVVADFAKAVILGENIVLYSNGKATRTFDYIPDATVGYLKCILYNDFDIFNIGSDEREITILELANMYQEIGKELFGYTGDIVFKTHIDKHYLTDNPKRRCPDISKARKLLRFSPKMDLKTGLKRYLSFVNEMEDEK
ncbi:NAD-dependent epimerase/dehydratase family protein [Vallitalea guaymasensis]|uniref:NAD-dependent epimerase/dehydratase family protein n=1 Tax=Vallitalea guaymasensis TaxID=1185412 RepID=UPI000DE237B5|nr:NAD-dependent epimerase/dehydratase family protein [Vallitalea guaymasensis]